MNASTFGSVSVLFSSSGSLATSRSIAVAPVAAADVLPCYRVVCQSILKCCYRGSLENEANRSSLSLFISRIFSQRSELPDCVGRSPLEQVACAKITLTRLDGARVAANSNKKKSDEIYSINMWKVARLCVAVFICGHDCTSLRVDSLLSSEKRLVDSVVLLGPLSCQAGRCLACLSRRRCVLSR